MTPLVRHPGSASGVAGVAVAASRRAPGQLLLSYQVSDPAGRLVLPPTAPPARLDGLWRATCLEAFLQLPDRTGYLELNLSPSRAWAAYGFAAYRSGMAPLAGIAAPQVDVTRDADGLALHADWDLSAVPGLGLDRTWRLGLTAVIADGAGLSYWALAHPPGDPDFHDPAGFVLELAPPA